MSNTKFKSALAATLMAFGIAGAAIQVEARTYGGTFDPVIADIGYMVGNFHYEQDDACRSPLWDGLHAVAGSCDPNQHFSDLTVNIFSNTNMLLATLTYAPPPSSPNAFFMYNGMPFGVDTGHIGPRFDLPAFPGQPFYLTFTMFVNPDFTLGSGLPALLPVVNLYGGTCSVPGTNPPLGCERGPLITQAFDLRFFEIPEPGTLALLFGALGAGLLARRRPRQG